MKRKILTTVSLLLVLLFAFGGCSNKAKPSEKTSSSAYFVNDDMALIVPDGTDPSTLIWNIKASMVKYVNPELDAAFEAGLDYIDPRDIMVNAITDITGPYLERRMSADFRYPDWYGGSYIMRRQEYGVDAPYETDGTDEPFKYCLQVVRGMESQIEDLKELLKPYEDCVIYKTVEFSVNQRIDFLDSVMKPAFDELGVKRAGCGPDFLTNAVDYDVYEEYFNEDIFALAKKLANEYGYTIIINRSGPGIAE